MQRTKGKPHKLSRAIAIPARDIPGAMCLLCDDWITAGQLIVPCGRYGWTHDDCARWGYLPPSATGKCGAPTRAGRPCVMAVVPGHRCRKHGG